MKSHAPALKPSTPARSQTAQTGTFFRAGDLPKDPSQPFFQTALEVSQPGDKHEIEADQMADHVVESQSSHREGSFFSPSRGVQRQPEISRVAFESQREDSLQRKEEEEETVEEKSFKSAPIQRMLSSDRPSHPASAFSSSRLHRAPRIHSPHSNPRHSRILRRARPGSHLTGNPRINPSRARGPPKVGSEFEQALRSSKGGGQSMSKRTRGEMESSFKADFSGVRIHTDAKAENMNRAVNAKAFAHGQDIYFSPNRYQPDDRSGKHLLAHELTHVVQQGHAVQRSPNTLSRAPPQIQRIPTSMDDVREEVNDLADNIPGYTLGTVLIGYNPILGRNVDWSASAFFRGAAGLLPGGTKLYDKLNEGGALDAAFKWIEERIAHHNLTWSRVKDLWSKAWDRMGITEGISGNVRIFKSTFSGFFSDIGSFIDDCIARLTEILTALAVKAVRALFGDNGPAYDMMAMVLRKDPITDEPREWVTVDFLRASMDFFGFENHRIKMEETGQLQEAADWLDTQFGILSGAIGGLIDGVKAIWNTFSLATLADPLSLLERIVAVVLGFISKMLEFVKNVALKILELIKAALIALLKPHLDSIPGYPLLRVSLGKDPITGELVPRTADNFILGFLSFVPGGRERYQNLKKSGAIDKALKWLLTTVNELGLSPSAIAETFLNLWNSFSIDDLMNPLPAFERIGRTLLTFVTNVLTLIAKVALKILEFVFIGVMGPAGARVVAALKQGKSTFNKIIKDPVGFLGNLLKAVGKGFGKFGTNIWKHLKAGLVGWLFGALSGAGLQLPDKFDLQGILSLVAQVLGLTYDRIRPKLVKRLGEKAVVGLEKSFEFVTLFLKEGFAGVWKKFVEYIGNLKDTFMGAIKEWIVTKIVTIAITKLATMSNPVGAVIEAIMAIYNVVMFFIERIEQILAVVESIIQSITKIADGKLEDAANFVEKTLARTLPVIISFMARLIGLGGIAAKIKGVITKIQKKVSLAVDKMLDWIVKQAKKVVAKFQGKGGKVDADKLTPKQRKEAARKDMEKWLDKGKHSGKAIVGRLKTIKDSYKLKDAKLELTPQGPRIAYIASPAEFTYFGKTTQEKAQDIPSGSGKKKFTRINSMNGVPTPYGVLKDTYGKLVLADKFKYHSATLDRPKGVTGEKEGASNSAHRSGSTVQTGAGNVGIDEQTVMNGKTSTIYRGGHLIAYVFLGDQSNAGYNLAPQVNRFNAPSYFKLIEEPGMNATQLVEMSVDLEYRRNDYEIDQATLVKNKVLSKIDDSKPWTVRIPQRIPYKWNAKLASKTDDPLPDGGVSKDTDTAKMGKIFTNAADFAADKVEVDGDKPEDKVQKWKSFKFLIKEGGQRNADGSISTGGTGKKNIEIAAEQIDYAPPPLTAKPAPTPTPPVSASRKGGPSKTDDDFDQSLQDSKGRGRPLESRVGKKMSQSFGRDFSRIKIHQDSTSIGLNQKIHSRAFAHGNDLYFNQNEYHPDRRSGQHLLAHELAHVAQQQGGTIPKSIQRKEEPSEESDPTPPQNEELNAESPSSGPEKENDEESGAPSIACPTLTWGDFTHVSAISGGYHALTWPSIGIDSNNFLTAEINSGASKVLKRYPDHDYHTIYGNPDLEECKETTKNGGWKSITRPGNCPAAFFPNTTKATTESECDTMDSEGAQMAAKEALRLLNHEQYHMNLVCAVTRKGNTALGTSPTKTEAKAMKAKVLKKINAAGISYDNETTHGCKSAEQSAWESKIKSGLPGVSF